MTIPIWKVLGQLLPAAATPGLLYEVDRGKQACVDSLTVCNQQNAATTFRVSVRIAGAGAANVQFLYYDTALSANSTVVFDSKLRLFTADQIYVQSASGQVSFNAFGKEEFV